MGDLSVEFNDKSFKSFMRNFRTQVSNMEPPFRQFGVEIRKLTNNQFQQEVEPDGTPWQQLSPSTIAQKKTPYKLRETLTMFRSMYVKVNRKDFKFGLRDDKYIYHHYGTSKMPARVVIGMTNDRYKILNKLIILHIKRVKNKK